MANGSSTTYTVSFNVDVGILRPWEYVFVCGSSTKLGDWIVSNSLKLSPSSESPFVILFC